MANHKGSEGDVKIGANSIAELKSWSLEETAETIDDTTINDTAKTFKPGSVSASGSAEAFWDETDTTGQGAMTIGAEVTMNVYPEGATSGDTYATFSAIITGISMSGAIDGMVEASFSFQVNGAVTWGTVV